MTFSDASLSARVAARYKKRKKTEDGNTVYLYSERQIALRNSKKAERLEKLRKNVHKLRARVKKDLASKDPETALIALVVGLMDHTAERVGNDESAEQSGHFGVTGWQKGHVTFSKDKATVKYVGKSGVKQKKVVTDKALVTALKEAHAGCEDGDLFCHDGGKITATKVNAYLKKFGRGITAKDLRGLHANSRMQEALKAARKAGGELPSDPKKRKAQLKKEWKKALDETAADVGHEPSTLNSQYLVPGLEDEFMKGGKVTDEMVKTAMRREARAKTLDESWVDKLRKDFLVLMRNLAKIQDYESAAQVRDAIKIYRANFDRWVFEEFLNQFKERDDHRFEGIRKPAWDFSIELSSMPLGYPDDYWSKESRFQRFEQEGPKWEQRLKRKAQVLWKVFRDALSYTTDRRVELHLPDEDSLVLEGFQVQIIGSDPNESSWQLDAFERFKEALRLYRRKAAKTLPWLIQKQLPLKLLFNAGLDAGGVYKRTHITISMSAMINQPPEWGVHMLAHEMGHHLYNTLGQSAKTFWDAAIRQDYGPLDLEDLMRQWPERIKWADDFAESLANSDPILALQIDVLMRERSGNAGWDTRERFQQALDAGMKTVAVPKHPITGYAGKNTEESFCEAIGRLVGYGSRTVLPQVRAWLEIVIPGMVKTAARVAERYVAAHRTRALP